MAALRHGVEEGAWSKSESLDQRYPLPSLRLGRKALSPAVQLFRTPLLDVFEGVQKAPSPLLQCQHWLTRSIQESSGRQ